MLILWLCSLMMTLNLACACRAPSLEVLAKDMQEPAPSFSKGLLESSGARLQYLQLVTSELGPAGELWDSFWTGLEACTELAALHLTFLVDPGQGTEQVIPRRSQPLPPAFPYETSQGNPLSSIFGSLLMAGPSHAMSNTAYNRLGK